MRILLVQPPSPFLIDDRAFVYLGPLQIAAVARDAGHEVAVCDLTGHSRRRNGACSLLEHSAEDVLAWSTALLHQSLREFKPDLVGFYALYSQFPTVVALRAECDVPTAIGGPHANTSPEECRAHGFDWVVVADQGGGGGEAGFLALLKLLEGPAHTRVALMPAFPGILKVPSRPPGVFYDRGEYVNDRWPYPARDLLDLEDYRYKIKGRRAVSIVSQAGCPFACHFCGHNDGYQKVALRSPTHVEGELRALMTAYPWIGAIMIYDDEINIRADFLDAFLPMLGRVGENGDRLIYRGFYKCGKSFMREEVFGAMARAGITSLCTGVEAADPAVLARVGKGATVEDNTRFVELCAKHGIDFKCFSMVGHPGETWQSVGRLRDWLISMVHLVNGRVQMDADVTILTPTRHTPIWDRPDKFPDLIFDRDGLDFGRELIHYKGRPGEYRCITRTPAMTSADIIEARQWVEDGFRTAAGLAPLPRGKDDG